MDLPPNSLTTWEEVTKAFLGQFYSLQKTAEMRAKIVTFNDKEGESLNEAWERFKSLLRECPHHDMGKEMQLHCFYNGLYSHNKMSLNAGSGGPIMMKGADEALQAIEHVVQNDRDWNKGERSSTSKRGGRYELDSIDLLTSKVDALVNQLKSSTMSPSSSNVSMLGNSQNPNSCPPPNMSHVNSYGNTSHSDHTNIPMHLLFCDTCGAYDHYSSQCNFVDSNTTSHSSMEQVNTSNQKFDPYSNTFNPGWGHNSNFGWKNQDQSSNQNGFQNVG